MAKTGRERARRCEKCAYQWWALEPGPPPKGLSWTDDLPGFINDAAARTTRKAGDFAFRRQAHMTAAERFGVCSRCGSHKVVTVREKGFVPTALREAQAPPSPPLPAPTLPVSTEETAPRLPPTQVQGAAGEEPFPEGLRVMVKALGFRGKTGRIAKHSRFGYSVELDEGQTVRGLQAKDIVHYEGYAAPVTTAPEQLPVGTRVLIKTMGWGGASGTITRLTRFGYNVATDDGKTARALQAKDLVIID